MTAAPSSLLRLAVAGDLALGGAFIRKARPRTAQSLAYPFLPLRPLLEATDLFVVNLEGPIGTGGTPRENRSVLLYNEPDVLDWLASFPHCICSLANNHAMDYGPEALQRTRQALSGRGIHAIGAGENAREAAKPVRLTIKGLTIGVLAFTTDEAHVGSVLAGADSPGSCGLPVVEEACARVRALAAEVDFVVVILHWGYEYFSYPSPDQVEFSRSAVGAGACLVLGHHPHVQQGLEQFGNGLIAYSFGNLLLPEFLNVEGRLQYRKRDSKQFCILQVELAEAKIRRWRLEGGHCTSDYQLTPYAGRRVREKFKNDMAMLSEALLKPGYEKFWESYKGRRAAGLRREDLRDAIAKLWLSDWRTLLRTISVTDVKRNARRIARIVGSLGRKRLQP